MSDVLIAVCCFAVGLLAGAGMTLMAVSGRQALQRKPKNGCWPEPLLALIEKANDVAAAWMGDESDDDESDDQEQMEEHARQPQRPVVLNREHQRRVIARRRRENRQRIAARQEQMLKGMIPDE